MIELQILFDALSISAETATALIARYDEATLLRHALQTLWQMSQGRITNPAGWFIASLRGNFTPPIGFRVSGTCTQFASNSTPPPSPKLNNARRNTQIG